jgi:Sugar transferases involved in lipopolysaccharide synthesis
MNKQDCNMKAYDGFYNRIGKRIIGFVLSLPLMILMLPFYLFISIAIIVDSGFPVLYRPLRGGYKNQCFIAGKFGTVGVHKKWCQECA